VTLLDVLLIALIRGLGEVLPLGASGVLGALSVLSGTPDGRAALAVATDAGIILALLLYFWRDVAAMGRGLWLAAKGKPDSGARLLAHVAIGTVPAALIGAGLAEAAARITSPVVAAGLVIAGGVLLLAADRLGVTVRRVEHLTLAGAAALGLMQVLALFPGVSRTGITLTVARLLGWERRDACRFSLLLALPLLAGHAALTLRTLAGHSHLVVSGDLQFAAALSGGVAWVAVAGMMAWVDRNSFAPFAFVRIVLGAAALALVLWGG